MRNDVAGVRRTECSPRLVSGDLAPDNAHLFLAVPALMQTVFVLVYFLMY
jgi:hypothetical protein